MTSLLIATTIRGYFSVHGKTRLLNARHYALAVALLGAAAFLGGCAGGIAEYDGTDALISRRIRRIRSRVWPGTGRRRPARSSAHIGVLKVLEEKRDRGRPGGAIRRRDVGLLRTACPPRRWSALHWSSIPRALSAFRPKGSGAMAMPSNNGCLTTHRGRALDMPGKKLAVTAAKRPGNELTVFNPRFHRRGRTGLGRHATPVFSGAHSWRGVHRWRRSRTGPDSCSARAGASGGHRSRCVGTCVRHPTFRAPAWTTRDRARAAKVAAQSVHADVMIHPDLGYYADIREPYR